MKRRAFFQTACVAFFGRQLLAAIEQGTVDAAADVLDQCTSTGQIDAAAFYVRQGQREWTRAFGAANSPDAIFLLASISKPISATAVMKLYDQRKFDLDDKVKRFIPEFAGAGRETITIRQLLTHVSGLPDQLPQNAELRSRHAQLPEFVAGAVKTPLLFKPGTRYSYSSMGILLATEIAQRISDRPISELVDRHVFQPLEMKHSALGLGRFQLESVMPCQVAGAAPESGAGDPATKSWDWNSRYWRELGVPWGGAHGSAADVGRFLDEFLHARGRALKPETSKLMVANHNQPQFRSRGLAFDIRPFSPGCSKQTFGHTGSTGTMCWADPATDTICVVLTTLPGRATAPHPRQTVSDHVAKAA